LAAARGADQPQHLALVDLEVDTLDSGLARVGDPELLSLHALLDLAAPALPLAGRAEQARGRRLDCLAGAVRALRRCDDGRLVIHHDAASGRWGLHRAHGSLPFREIRSTTKFIRITTIRRTNAAA